MRVDTDFPGGGADEIRISGDTVEFAAPRKGCPRPMWFCLRVAGAAGRMVRFRLVNGGQCLGGDHVAVTQPVWRDALGRWRRVPRTSCRYAGGVLEFALRPNGETVVASCYPYQLADLESWLAGLRQPATWVTKGRSAGGRPVHLVEVADPRREAGTLVCVTARQHAGETPGSFVVEGMVAELLRPAARPRPRYLFAPMVDVDATEEGSYGKDQPPVDFNRDWSSAPHHPPVRVIAEAIEQAAAAARYVLFLDVHSPTPGDGTYFVPAHGSAGDRAYRDECWRLASLTAGEAPADCPVAPRFPPGALNWSYENAEMVATESHRLRYGVPAMTLEVAYHRTGGGHLLHPDQWRRMGRAVVRAVDRWLAGESGTPPPPPPVPLLESWVVPHLPREVTLREEAGAVVAAPDGKAAGFWVQCRPLLRGPAKLAVVNQGDLPLRLGWRLYPYDSRGLRFPEWRTGELTAPPGRSVHGLGPEPAGAAGWRCALTADGLAAPVRIESPRADGQGAR